MISIKRNIRKRKRQVSKDQFFHKMLLIVVRETEIILKIVGLTIIKSQQNFIQSVLCMNWPQTCRI